MDNVFEAVKQKHQERKDKKVATAAAFAEKVNSGEKLLVAERTPTGLYTVRFEGGGQLPRELNGTFTSIDRVRTLVTTRYGKDILKT